MTSDQIVDRIVDAAAKSDAAAVRSALNDLQRRMADTGTRLSDSNARRLIEAMTTLPLQGGDRDPHGLADDVVRHAKPKQGPVDRTALAQCWSKLYLLMADCSVAIEDRLTRDVLASLRSARAFALLAQTADRALLRNYGTSGDDPHFRRLYGQALIDNGNLIAGIEVLENTLRQGPLPLVELRQVQGLLGRAHKQIYVNHAFPPGSRSRAIAQYGPALAKAASFYAADFDPQRVVETCWHGINLVAVLKRAQTDGVRVDIPQRAEELARVLIEALAPKIDAGTADIWEVATVAEAQYALGSYENARENFARYAERADLFALVGTARQLQEVWRAQEAGDTRALECLQVLNAALAEQDRSTVVISRQEAAQLHNAMQVDEQRGRLESPTAGGGFVKIGVLYSLIKSASAVASVRAKKAVAHFGAGDRVGTAFLFSGEQLKLEPGLYMMTNAHVLSPVDYPRHDTEWPLEPGNAEIIFEQTLTGGPVKLSFDPEIVHNFHSSDHDCTILRVTEAPAGIDPLPLEMERGIDVRDKPQKGKSGTKVCVIGHPEGKELQISFKDNFFKGDNGQIVDHGPRQRGSEGPIFIHYDTPTIGGNSGSPVFERNSWKVVGLHHAGVGYERLNSAGGRQEANEGIYIKSIEAAIAKTRKPAAPVKEAFWRRRKSSSSD